MSVSVSTYRIPFWIKTLGLRERYILTNQGKLRFRAKALLAVLLMNGLLALSFYASEVSVPKFSNIAFFDITKSSSDTAPYDDFAHGIETNSDDKSEQTAFEQIKEEAQTLLALVTPPAEKPAKRVFTIQKGDSLSGLLHKASIPDQDVYKIVQEIKKEYNPKDMRVGQRVVLDLEQFDKGTAFKTMRIEKSQLEYVELARIDNGQYNVKSFERSYKINTHLAEAVIDSSTPSLYIALSKAEVPADIIGQIIQNYSWDIDFQRDIHPGNTITVLYDKAQLDDGQTVYGKGKVIYASLTTLGEEIPMYQFKKNDGRIDYFTEKGYSIRKALLSTPVDGARISSGYGYRKHPVLGYNKLHKGTDFAAPRGTPIYAAGDGIIERANWFSSFGNYVKIRHNGSLKTAYAHLKGFAKGIKAGARVKQGQVIGYIGTTGRSTGPHLHYEVHKDGKQVNPNSLKLPTGEQLKGEDLKRFEKVRNNIDQKIKSLKRGSTRVALLRP